jgi:hypothetical protein
MTFLAAVADGGEVPRGGRVGGDREDDGACYRGD